MDRPSSETIKFLFGEGGLIMNRTTEDDFIETGMRLIENVLQPFLRIAPLPQLRTRLDPAVRGLTNIQQSQRVFDLMIACLAPDKTTWHQFFLTESGYIVIAKTDAYTSDCEVEYSTPEERKSTLRRIYQLWMSTQPDDPTRTIDPTLRLIEAVDGTLRRMHNKAKKSAKLTKSFRKTTHEAIKRYKEANFR